MAHNSGQGQLSLPSLQDR